MFGAYNWIEIDNSQDSSYVEVRNEGRIEELFFVWALKEISYKVYMWGLSMAQYLQFVQDLKVCLNFFL